MVHEGPSELGSSPVMRASSVRIGQKVLPLLAARIIGLQICWAIAHLWNCVSQKWFAQNEPPTSVACHQIGSWLKYTSFAMFVDASLADMPPLACFISRPMPFLCAARYVAPATLVSSLKSR